jgi:hypothetical protein
MELPVQITYRGVNPSDALSRLIRKEARKLDEFFDRIVSCRVLVEREQRHLRSGAPFRRAYRPYGARQGTRRRHGP